MLVDRLHLLQDSKQKAVFGKAEHAEAQETAEAPEMVDLGSLLL